MIKSLISIITLCVLTLTVEGWAQTPNTQEVSDDLAVETFLYFLMPKDAEDEKIVDSFLEHHELKEHGEELKTKARKLVEWRIGQNERAKKGDPQIRLQKDRDDYIGNEVRDFNEKPKLKAFLQIVKKNVNKKGLTEDEISASNNHPTCNKQ